MEGERPKGKQHCGQYSILKMSSVYGTLTVVIAIAGWNLRVLRVKSLDWGWGAIFFTFILISLIPAGNALIWRRELHSRGTSLFLSPPRETEIKCLL